MKIGLVIVSYCGVKDTKSCISSIVSAKRTDMTIDVVVVDNDSPKNPITSDEIKDVAIANNLQIMNSVCSGETLENSYLERINIILIRSDKNGGFGYANNKGINYLKQRGCDLCILLNNDTILTSDFFLNIRKRFIDVHYRLAVSPLSINYFSKKIDSKGFGYMSPWTGRCSHIKKYKIKYLVGSCIAMNFVDDIPLFDEMFFLYYEDVDYSMQLENKNYLLSFDDNAVFYHKVSQSTSLNPYIEIEKIRSCKHLFFKRFGLFNQLVYKLTRTIYYVIKLRFDFFKKLFENENYV
jgi:hypothetical protein